MTKILTALDWERHWGAALTDTKCCGRRSLAMPGAGPNAAPLGPRKRTCGQITLGAFPRTTLAEPREACGTEKKVRDDPRGAPKQHAPVLARAPAHTVRQLLED